MDVVDNLVREAEKLAMEEMSEMSVGGDYLKFDNGYWFAFKILGFLPRKVLKDPYIKKEGAKKQMKFEWDILFLKWGVQNQTTVDYNKLEENKPEKCKKIEEQAINKKLVLELPKTGSKELAGFVKAHGLVDERGQVVKMWRTGESNKTKYNFSLSI